LYQLRQRIWPPAEPAYRVCLRTGLDINKEEGGAGG
jgi:hypothetical protein